MLLKKLETVNEKEIKEYITYLVDVIKSGNIHKTDFISALNRYLTTLFDAVIDTPLLSQHLVEVII